MDELLTPRLRLRRWQPADAGSFAAMNDDPAVMEFFPGRIDLEETRQTIGRIEAGFEQNGFGLWAVEVPGVADFIGYVGLNVPRFQAAFTPCVEVGWRLAAAHWGKGYATEGARAALTHGFRTLGLREIVSFTVPANVRSRAVMERLGMRRDPAEDFDHPLLPAGHPLCRHVLYRLPRPTTVDTANHFSINSESAAGYPSPDRAKPSNS